MGHKRAKGNPLSFGIKHELALSTLMQDQWDPGCFAECAPSLDSWCACFRAISYRFVLEDMHS
jgi:hypothetical protein